MIIDEIKKLLNPKALIDMNAEKGLLRIKESGIDAKLKQIDIIGVDVDLTVAFKLDSYPQLSPYFNRSEKNVNKGCDAIILTQTNNQRASCKTPGFTWGYSHSTPTGLIGF
jgi:hypothetical protein